MSRRLLVVGNAPLGEDCGAFVDSHELVVRFNDTPHFHTGLSGWKTSVLYIGGHELWRVFDGPTRFNDFRPMALFSVLHPRVVADAGTFWLGREPRFLREVMTANGLAGKTVRVLDELGAEGTPRTAAPGSPYPLCVYPSAGLRVLHHLLHDVAYTGYALTVIGFTWEGLPSHQWHEEKRLFRKWKKEGRVKILKADFATP